MRGSLGEKIAEGAFADVHAWAPGQVVKLFKAGVPRRVSRHEARMTRPVFAAGAPAPEVFDEVTLEGADLHPGNVIMTADGPRIVDWTGAVRAPAAFDLGCCHIAMTELAPEVADDPRRPRAVNAL